MENRCCNCGKDGAPHATDDGPLCDSCNSGCDGITGMTHYMRTVRKLASRPARTYDDVMWQVELETHCGLDSDEFFSRIEVRCEALGISTAKP
jgi:hypothetical protein